VLFPSRYGLTLLGPASAAEVWCRTQCGRTAHCSTDRPPHAPWAAITPPNWLVTYHYRPPLADITTVMPVIYDYTWEWLNSFNVSSEMCRRLNTSGGFTCLHLRRPFIHKAVVQGLDSTLHEVLRHVRQPIGSASHFAAMRCKKSPHTHTHTQPFVYCVVWLTSANLAKHLHAGRGENTGTGSMTQSPVTTLLQ
jgi:hypothetical protein